MADAPVPLSTFMDIPEELVDKIFEFLFKIDLVSAQKVCRYFYNRVQRVMKKEGIKNLKMLGHSVGVIPKKWDKLRCEEGILYFHYMNEVAVFNPDGTTTTMRYDIAPDSRFTSVTMLPDGGMITTGYTDQVTIWTPSVGEDVPNNQKVGLGDGKTVINAVVKNRKIYTCTGFNQVNVWDLNGNPVGDFETPFCSSELTLSSDGTVIFVYFKKQNRLYAYREDDHKYIAEFHFVKYKASMTSMRTYGRKLYVLLTSGNINIFEASKGAVVFSKVIKTGRPVVKFCPFGTNILVQIRDEYFVVNIDTRKISFKLNFGIRPPHDFVLGPCGDLEFLYFSRDAF